MTYVKENFTNQVTIYNNKDDIIIRYTFVNAMKNVPSVQECRNLLKDVVENAKKNRKD